MADMTIREKFFADKAAGALWDVAVSIKRGNPLPLDSNSVFQSYADLETYAAGVLAYPGQVVAVVNENSTAIYFLDQDLNIQPVGAADGQSIDFNADGKLEVKGFKSAASFTLPQKQADGSIKWVAISEIVEGDGNTVTTIEAADASVDVELTTDTEESKEYSVKVNISAEEGNQLVLGEDGLYVAEFDDSDLLDEINKKANAADVYSKTDADALLEAKANASDVYSKTEANSLLAAKADASAVYTKEEANSLFGGAFHFRGDADSLDALNALENKAIGDVYQVADKEYAWDGAEWVELGFNIDLSEYAKKGDSYTKSEADALLETKANAADVYTSDEVDGLLDAKANADDVYTADEVDGLLADKADAADVYDKNDVDALLADKADVADLDDYAKAADVYTTEELDAILADKLEAEDLADYAKTADLAPYAKTEDVNAELAKKLDASEKEGLVNSINAKLDIATYESEKSSFATDAELAAAIGQAPTRSEGEDGEVSWDGATGIYTNIYTKDEITDLIADITGGESAADVLAALNAYKTSTDPRIKALEDVGAQANVLEKVKVNGVELEIGADKSVNIPVGGADLGVVKTSTATNKVAIAENGEMEVNALSVDKLTQADGEYVVLYGGSASDNI